MNGKQTWQATVIALGFLAAVTAIFLSVFWKEGIDSALKAWAGVGTIVAVVVGAIPSYFFGAREATAAREDARNATKQLEAASTARKEAEERARLVLGHADPTLVEKLSQQYPAVFNP